MPSRPGHPLPWELVPEGSSPAGELLGTVAASAAGATAGASSRPTAASASSAPRGSSSSGELRGPAAADAPGDVAAAFWRVGLAEAAVGTEGAFSRPTAAAAFSTTATAGVDGGVPRDTAPEGTEEAPSPWEDFELDVEDVYILVAVEFDRRALRADFIVRDQILPAYFPL